MDTSDSEQERTGRREETLIAYYNILYSPCHICEVFVKTILKCLGHDYPRFQPINPPTQDTASEVEMKSKDDPGVGELSRREVTAARSRPTRPHISSGRGGQIN